jgi:putative intracellular protease/amidase
MNKYLLGAVGLIAAVLGPIGCAEKTGDDAGAADQAVSSGGARPTQRFLHDGGPKVLVVVSAAKTIDLKPPTATFLPSVAIAGSDTATPSNDYITGVFAREASGPLLALAQLGYSFDFATQDGEVPTWDANGLELPWFFLGDRDPLFFARDVALVQQHRDQQVSLLSEAFGPLEISAKETTPELRSAMARWAGWNVDARPKPLSLADVASKIDTSSYVGLVVPGGHAPMSDLAFNPDLGRIVQHFHDAKKPIGLICHGPVALMSTFAATKEAEAVDGGWKFQTPEDRANRLNDWHAMKGKVEWPFAGYRLTVESTAEEQVMEEVFAGRRRVAYYVDHEMEEMGGVLAPAQGVPVLFPGLVTAAIVASVPFVDPIQALLQTSMPKSPITITMKSLINLVTDDNPQLKEAVDDENRAGRIWLPGMSAVTADREVVTGANPGSAFCVGQTMDRIIKKAGNTSGAIDCERFRP